MASLLGNSKATSSHEYYSDSMRDKKGIFVIR